MRCSVNMRLPAGQATTVPETDWKTETSRSALDVDPFLYGSVV